MSVSISANNRSAGVGGLCHLMEAATALSKLVEAPSHSKQPSAVPLVEQQQQQQQQRSLISDDDESCKKIATKSNREYSSDSMTKREIFPQRLMAVLSDASLTEVVTWLPNGKSFVIVRPDVFTEKVLPKYLPPVDARGSTKYPSFTRKLNRWGFRQVTRGPDTGAFHHPHFQRDEPRLCLQMVCQRSRDRRSASKQGISSLPPKKRPFASTSGHGLPVLQTATTTLPPSAASAVSLDGSHSSSSVSISGSSNGRSVVSGFLKVPPTHASALACGPATAAINAQQQPLLAAAFVSKDEALIKDALKQSQEQERMRAAKAMLYHSYMQALGAAESTSMPPLGR